MNAEADQTNRKFTAPLGVLINGPKGPLKNGGGNPVVCFSSQNR